MAASSFSIALQPTLALPVSGNVVHVFRPGRDLLASAGTATRRTNCLRRAHVALYPDEHSVGLSGGRLCHFHKSVRHLRRSFARGPAAYKSISLREAGNGAFRGSYSYTRRRDR